MKTILMLSALFSALMLHPMYSLGATPLGAITCNEVKGYEQIIKNFNQLVEGFNSKKWDLIEPVTDDNVTLTRFEKNAKTHKKGKANYKKHLEDDAWKKNPK